MSAAARPVLTIFCAGALKAAVTKFVPRFERETGCDVHLVFGAATNLQRRLEQGEHADVLIATPPVFSALSACKVALTPGIVIGSVGVGIAVRQDFACPDVSDPARLRTCLLEARSLACADPTTGDSSGVHFHHVLERLGIVDAVRAKSVWAPMGLVVAELVLGGQADLGATQASVILGCEGLVLAGLLPDELQHQTVYQLGLVCTDAPNPLARRWVDHLTTQEARHTFERHGIRRP